MSPSLVHSNSARTLMVHIISKCKAVTLREALEALRGNR